MSRRRNDVAENQSPRIAIRGLAATVAAVIGVLGLARGDDWPQFLGPKRDGISKETGLNLQWPKDGPPRVWDKKIGEGFSGPVIAGDRLILFHRVGDEEVVECLDASTGKGRWRHAYATQYEDQLGKGNGPRATPTVAGQRVITLGAEGTLSCLGLDDGKPLWSRSIVKDYNVPQSYFGVGTSPLVDNDLVLVNVGGKGAGIVAFALATGKEVWRAGNDGASYASPIACTADGVRHALFFTREGVVLLDPAKGTERFRTRWRARYDASVNAATPLVIGDRAFISASYETGALLLKLKKDGAEVAWKNDEIMSNHYNTCVYHDGHLYGFDGRQESGANFRCVDLDAQKVTWNRPRFGCGTMVLADGHLIVLTERGDLVAVEASPNAYREKARAHVFDALPCRAQVALAHGRLYARDQSHLVCWNLKK
jgi:outer membrane protein assembly factor BamB